MQLDRDRPAEALRSLETTPRALAESRWHWEPLVVAAWDAIAKAHARLGHRREAVAALAAAEDALKSANIPRVASDVHATEALVWAALGDYPQANAALQAQMKSDAQSAQAADEGRMQELRVRFESDLKDRDNALLRARTAQAESRRTATSLALVAAVLLFGGGALLLQLRLRTTRAANRLMATLADNGRLMTSGLDRAALVRMLEGQLADLVAPASTVVSLLQDDDGSARVDAPTPPAAWAAQMQALRRRCEQASEEVSMRLPAAWGAARWRPWRALRGARLVAEPLLDGPRLLGVVTVAFDEGGRWGNRERQILRTTCVYAAVALANIRSARLLGEAQVELEQERTRDMLVHTARLVTVGSMASGIVHEMAHPVGAMMLQSSNAQASLEMGEPGEANDALSGIHREAKRLHNLILRLRNLCRADQPNIEEMDLLDVLEDARVLFLPQLQMARVEFVQQASSVRVTVDSERVVLAIANIVFNAIDAMEGRDDRRVEITTSVRDDLACVDIRDTGPGLTPAQLARLFEPFYTTKPPGKGLGLGLALSVKSVASMNGRIEAANHADGGAVFTICVPVASMSSAASTTSRLSTTDH